MICFSDPAGIRTQDPYIKSVLLYQLSYRIIYSYFDASTRLVDLHTGTKIKSGRSFRFLS